MLPFPWGSKKEKRYKRDSYNLGIIVSRRIFKRDSPFSIRFRYKGKLSCWETKAEEREREIKIQISVFLQILFLEIWKGKKRKKVCQIHSFLSLSYSSQNSSPSFQISLRNRSLEYKLARVSSPSKKKEKSWSIRRHPLATQRVSYRFPKRNKAVSRGFQVALRKEFTFWKTFYNYPSFPTASPFPFRKLLLASVPSKNFTPTLFLPPLCSFSGWYQEKILLSLSLSLSWTATGAVTDRSSAHVLFIPLPAIEIAASPKGALLPPSSSSFPSGTPLKGVGFRGKPVENCRPQPATLWPPFIGLVRGGLSFMQSVSATWEELCGIPLTW